MKTFNSYVFCLAVGSASSQIVWPHAIWNCSVRLKFEHPTRRTFGRPEKVIHKKTFNSYAFCFALASASCKVAPWGQAVVLFPASKSIRRALDEAAGEGKYFFIIEVPPVFPGRALDLLAGE